MSSEDLFDRTKKFAIRIIKLVEALPSNAPGRAIGSQIIRSGMSVGANYRAARRGKSSPDFIAKLAIVIEEADETVFWLELIIDSKLLAENMVGPLLTEANELTAIFCKSRITAQKNLNNGKK